VVYSTLVAEDGGPLEEAAAAADVRPRPPREGRREFAVHEAVEALHHDGWWAGVVSAARQPVAGATRVYEVTFPTSRETMEFEETAMRRRRVFQAGRWVPAAEAVSGLAPLFYKLGLCYSSVFRCSIRVFRCSIRVFRYSIRVFRYSIAV
jgi:hypothetical protein